MEAVKVLARYVNGTALTGFTYDFSASKDRFHVNSSTPLAGKRVEVLLKDLKAVLFCREFEGNRQDRERNASLEGERHVGRKVEVTFQDGEALVGSTLGCGGRRTGFFLFPADARANGLRVFVVSKAVRTIRYLDEAEERSRPQASPPPSTPGSPGTQKNAAPLLDSRLGQPTVIAAPPRRSRERRRAKRVRPNEPLQVRVFCYANVTVLNISAIGLLFEHTAPFPPGLGCQLELERSGQRIRLRGEVVRSFVAAIRGSDGTIQYRTAVRLQETYPPLLALLPELRGDSGSPIKMFTGPSPIMTGLDGAPVAKGWVGS
jgi:hypothetical protein